MYCAAAWAPSRSSRMPVHSARSKWLEQLVVHAPFVHRVRGCSSSWSTSSCPPRHWARLRAAPVVQAAAAAAAAATDSASAAVLAVGVPARRETAVFAARWEAWSRQRSLSRMSRPVVNTGNHVLSRRPRRGLLWCRFQGALIPAYCQRRLAWLHAGRPPQVVSASGHFPPPTVSPT